MCWYSPCKLCDIVLLATLQDVKVIAVWFRVDARPFKQALLTTVEMELPVQAAPCLQQVGMGAEARGMGPPESLIS